MELTEQLDEPLLVELHRYWIGCANGRRAPARSDIDPIDIPRVLPYVTLIEVVDRAGRFRCRLAGTKVEAMYGCALTNCFVDEVIDGRYRDHLLGLFRTLVDGFAPVYSETWFQADKAQRSHVKSLMLPLSDDQEDINMVLSATVSTPDCANDKSAPLRIQDHFEPNNVTTRKL